MWWQEADETARRCWHFFSGRFHNIPLFCHWRRFSPYLYHTLERLLLKPDHPGHSWIATAVLLDCRFQRRLSHDLLLVQTSGVGILSLIVQLLFHRWWCFWCKINLGLTTCGFRTYWVSLYFSPPFLSSPCVVRYTDCHLNNISLYCSRSFLHQDEGVKGWLSLISDCWQLWRMTSR